ncbi:MAG: peptidoglycan-binding protein [Clostridia bacterium]|nr:peptidoglycan-binding protein [Clostridia bacterium]
MNQANLPYVPEYITVHLGAPDAEARNVTVPFIDYIENVASSEIYPTWPDSAIRANVYAQVSFALNRIYTEFYRAKGYPFDITNNTAYDQAFVYGRDIFENVRRIVGDIFNDYIRRQGSIEPLFAQYCNGTTVTCPGLSQWGTVGLAEQGYTPYDILTYYYGDNIDIVRNAPIRGRTLSYPGSAVRLGDVSADVKTIQVRLNRISDNYPSIPKIAVADGIFSYDTEAAVRAFQDIFGLAADGIVGKSTWYGIQRIYNAVKRITELNSEGITLEEVSSQFPGVLQEGDTGNGVRNLQYYISYVAGYYDSIPPVSIDGVFGEQTVNAVKDVQSTFGLAVDGIVGEATWDALYRAYRGIIDTVPSKFTEGVAIPFPGVVLRLGAESEDVRIVQEYLNFISQTYTQIPGVTPTGYFGNMTRESVLAFQRVFGLDVTGVVGAITWSAIAAVYEDLYSGARLGEGQFPGQTIG